MSELILFVRPPRPLWPFNGPGTAFWPPLAFASLAAALREAMPDLRVAILDAPALQMGWRTLAAELERLHPGYIGIGEEAVSCIEGLRVAEMAKAVGARVIAGGCFFAHAAAEALATGVIDVVVHGEGETTIVELVEALRSGTTEDLHRVAGISFRNSNSSVIPSARFWREESAFRPCSPGEIVFTGHRQPLADLDSLPFPAYDLLPVERYGAASRNHPTLAAIELGRGCAHGCDFCVLWRQMGKFRDRAPTPLLRVKSPERVLEEVRILRERFGRRYLGWVDPCFNAHPTAAHQTAELLLKHGLQMGQSAWVRADCLLRDHHSGALAAMVASGLNEIYVGIERTTDDDLDALGKDRLAADVTAEALHLIAERYPQVVTVGSFIYGLPNDTPGRIRALYREATRLPLDVMLFIPLTPLPGTPAWRAEMWQPERLRKFDFLPHVNGNPQHARLTMALLTSSVLSWSPARVRAIGGGVFAADARRRSVSRRHLGRIMPFVLRSAINGLLRRNTAGMQFPRWYEK